MLEVLKLRLVCMFAKQEPAATWQAMETDIQVSQEKTEHILIIAYIPSSQFLGSVIFKIFPLTNY